VPTKKKSTSVRPFADFPTHYWEHILSSVEEGILVIDQAYAVRFINAAAEQLIGLSHAQVLGRPYMEAFTLNPWVVEIAQRTEVLGSRPTAGEGELQTRFVRPTPVRLTCSPIITSEGTALGLVLVLHDLSHQKARQKEEQDVAHLAQLGVIAAGLAHEIKNPLAGIRGATQLLQRKIHHDPSAFEYTTVMLREIDRLNALLQQLLQLSPTPALTGSPHNVHKILTEVLLLERETAPKGVKIIQQFDPSLPDILGDESQLMQVFRNIIKNGLQALTSVRGGVLTIATRMATDFHILRSYDFESADPTQFIAGAPTSSVPRPPKSQTNVSSGTSLPTSRPPRLLTVTFSDNGPGIAPEHLPHLFTPFFTTKTHGTGLGLAISQRIIVHHGGTIRVESTPGYGTTFSVYLPVAP
jgi:two-component system, NtrC family, nitrogen regulation sensor histidine kinase GlnL